jgi:hypothetical protein
VCAERLETQLDDVLLGIEFVPVDASLCFPSSFFPFGALFCPQSLALLTSLERSLSLFYGRFDLFWS